jgi:lipopolysaccharide transport system ATP-binding protein
MESAALTNSREPSFAEASESYGVRSEPSIVPMEEYAISVEAVTKKYTLWQSPSARLWHLLIDRIASSVPSWLRSRVQKKQQTLRNDFFAVHNISFQVRVGESVGILGRNGSGKSTLLQMIAGTLRPTSGQVRTRGKIAALLELGSGFNPEFTGRENVFLNSAILGLSRKETEHRFEQIEAFADIGKFIDQPVKTYSSGMLIRLAFSVAVHVDADILIVDEALAVGDIFFQQKCFRKIREILDSGVTLLFVSHDSVALQNLCKRGLLLYQGEKVFDGPAEQCAHRYVREAFATVHVREQIAETSKQATDNTEQGPERHSRRVPAEEKSAILASNILDTAKARHGERVLEYLGAAFSNHEGNHLPTIPFCEEGILSLLVRANQSISDPEVVIRIVDRLTNIVFCTCNHSLNLSLGAFHEGDEFIVKFKLRFTVEVGYYTLTLETGKLAGDRPSMGVYFDVLEGVGPIQVYDPNPDQIRPFYGMVQLPCKVTLI